MLFAVPFPGGRLLVVGGIKIVHCSQKATPIVLQNASRINENRAYHSTLSPLTPRAYLKGHVDFLGRFLCVDVGVLHGPGQHSW